MRTAFRYFYYIYFKLVMEFMWLIQKKESVTFNFFSTDFLSCNLVIAQASNGPCS